MTRPWAQLGRTPRNTSRFKVETREEVPRALPLRVHLIVIRACLRGPLQKNLCGEPGPHGFRFECAPKIAMDLSKLRIPVVNNPAMLQERIGKREHDVCGRLISFGQQYELVGDKLKRDLEPLPQ